MYEKSPGPVSGMIRAISLAYCMAKAVQSPVNSVAITSTGTRRRKYSGATKISEFKTTESFVDNSCETNSVVPGYILAALLFVYPGK